MGPPSPNPEEIRVTKVISRSPPTSTMKATQMKKKRTMVQRGPSDIKNNVQLSCKSQSSLFFHILYNSIMT